VAAIELPAEVVQAEALLFAAKRLIVQLADFSPRARRRAAPRLPD